MKKMLIIAIAILTQACAISNDWSKSDKFRQGAYTALHIADWGQTRDIAAHPTREEGNIIMGKKPTKDEVDLYFASTLAIHYAVANWLDPEYRKYFQYGTIGVQIWAVEHNYSAGVKIRF